MVRLDSKGRIVSGTLRKGYHHKLARVPPLFDDEFASQSDKTRAIRLSKIAIEEHDTPRGTQARAQSHLKNHRSCVWDERKKAFLPDEPCKENDFCNVYKIGRG